jgi:phage-related protein
MGVAAAQWKEYILSLDLRDSASISRGIGRLVEQNVRAREPLVRHIEGSLWELRVGSRGNIYRAMYFFFTGRRIVVLHAFEKKSQKMPRRELEVARQRYHDFVARFGG